MRRLLALVCTLLLLCSVLAGPGAPASAAVEVDLHLQQALATAAADAALTVILTYDRPPDAADMAAVTATGAAAYRFRWLPMIAARGTAAQVQALLNQPGLVSAYLNRDISFYLNGSVPYIGADRVWSDLGFTGAGVTVAVLDTGIDGTHPDLSSRLKANVKILDPLVTGGGYTATEMANTDTTSGHGTHVAGTVAGTGAASDGYYTGVAPGADLVGVGVGDGQNILFALEGLDWIGRNADSLGIRIVSNSWGTSGAFSPNDPINVATKQLYDVHQMAIVFAAGNAGPGENTLNPYSVAPWVIGVANGTKAGLLANSSSRGIPGDPLYHPTITAPGTLIAAARASTGVLVTGVGAVNDVTGCTRAEYVVYYTCISGTSMATPHISGVLALMMQARPGLHPDLLKQALVDTARPMFRPDGSQYAQFEVGAGYVDAYAAVQRARATGLQKDK